MQSHWLEQKYVKNFEVAKKYMEKTEISKEQIHQYFFADKLSEGTVGVPGIFNLHVMESSSVPTTLCRNADYFSNTADITVFLQHFGEMLNI